MHYYQFNIGDYASHTQRLSLMEDLAYRRLLDEYYLHERPFNSGVASVARQIGMREHEAEVQFILECFFQLTEDGWLNKRADEEVAQYRSKIEQASKAGKASAERRFNAGLTDVQPNIKHKPLNIKQETKNTAPSGVTDSVWQDFVKLRKAKKAAITETAIKGIEREAKKAGVSLQVAIETCCERGWAGFKADWLQSSKPATNLAAARTIFGDERTFNETLSIT